MFYVDLVQNGSKGYCYVFFNTKSSYDETNIKLIPYTFVLNLIFF